MSATIKLKRDSARHSSCDRGRFEIDLDGTGVGSIGWRSDGRDARRAGASHPPRSRPADTPAATEAFEVSDGDMVNFRCHGAMPGQGMSPRSSRLTWGSRSSADEQLERGRAAPQRPRKLTMAALTSSGKVQPMLCRPFSISTTVRSAISFSSRSLAAVASNGRTRSALHGPPELGRRSREDPRGSRVPDAVRRQPIVADRYAYVDDRAASSRTNSGDSGVFRLGASRAIRSCNRSLARSRAPATGIRTARDWSRPLRSVGAGLGFRGVRYRCELPGVGGGVAGGPPEPEPGVRDDRAGDADGGAGSDDRLDCVADDRWRPRRRGASVVGGDVVFAGGHDRRGGSRAGLVICSAASWSFRSARSCSWSGRRSAALRRAWSG